MLLSQEARQQVTNNIPEKYLVSVIALPQGFVEQCLKSVGFSFF